jgi:HEAT repeat protein
VIDHVWADFVNQKALLEERDETISKLYARLTALEDASKRGPLTSLSHPVRPLSLQLAHTVLKLNSSCDVLVRVL